MALLFVVSFGLVFVVDCIEFSFDEKWDERFGGLLCGGLSVARGEGSWFFSRSWCLEWRCFKEVVIDGGRIGFTRGDDFYWLHCV